MEDWSFGVTAGELTWASGEGRDVVIPNTVTEIGESVFLGKKIRRVEIPDGVEIIGRWAFKDCTRLTKVDIPASVKEIKGDHGSYEYTYTLWESTHTGYKDYPRGAFEGCSELKEVVLHEGLETIGIAAFLDCSSLEKIHIPASVRIIEEAAFRGCHALREVTFSEGIEIIGENAFRECNGLTSVSLPKSLKQLGIAAFGTCVNLKSVTIPDNIQYMDGGCFSECENLINVSISPALLEGVAKGAFVCTPFYETTQVYKQEKERERAQAWRTLGLCEFCGGRLGLFRKCKSCGRSNTR